MSRNVHCLLDHMGKKLLILQIKHTLVVYGENIYIKYVINEKCTCRDLKSRRPLGPIVVPLAGTSAAGETEHLIT